MDAVIIFGAAVRSGGRPSGAMTRRVDAAFACGSRLPNPLYIPTGGAGRHGPSEASVMARLLTTRGVGPEQIRLEETGRDTLQSVRAVHRILRSRNHQGEVYVATSGYHLPRCLLLLRILGLRAKPCAAATPPGLRRWYWRLREIPALPYDAALAAWLRLTRRGLNESNVRNQ